MKIITSIGDLNGIGLETFTKAIALCPANFFENNSIAIVSSISNIYDYLSKINFPFSIDDNFLIIDNKRVEIIEINSNSQIEFGKISTQSAAIALSSLQLATDLVLSKQYDALLTLPISKNAMHLLDFAYPGHTEYLAMRDNTNSPLMILFNDQMRVALATIHIPLKDVSNTISKVHIEKTMKMFYNSLKIDFAINNPKIAVLGLNPHAGENGDIGNEEIEILNPVIKEMSIDNYSLGGTFPADSFFARNNWKNYDGILAMYHDQGLIPMKMTSKNGGVNFTAGLSFVRTSPDHGTGFDIAGKNIANGNSTLQALIWVEKIASNRIIFQE